ncbi:MAG: hypothetical protein KatS3mg109_1079 [Pirellulaceae bacterium]|nr:MAG: hypothetical protein KatS3mg109_1079 [Pirellulaceae bacterium]
MRIAVIGWGSLIWDPRKLRIRDGWKDDGPWLPIEFARISQRDRLTLVMHPGVKLQQTYWAISEFADLNSVRENLKTREGTVLQYIHSVTRNDISEDKIRDAIIKWLIAHKMDAAVWTGLPSNFREKRGVEFSVDEAVRYLRELVDSRRHKNAEGYIRRTPRRIRTEVRKRAEKEFGWLPSDNT